MSLLIKNAVRNNIKKDVLITEGFISKIEHNIDDPEIMKAEEIFNIATGLDASTLIPLDNPHTRINS